MHRFRRLTRFSPVLPLICSLLLISETCRAVPVEEPYYVEINLPRTARESAEPRTPGILQMKLLDTPDRAVCFETPEIVARDTLLQTFFFKIEGRHEAMVSWISAGDTLVSPPFVISSALSDLRVVINPPHLRVQYIRLQFPVPTRRSTSLGLVFLLALCLKTLIAALVLLFLRKNWKILGISLLSFSITIVMSYYLPHSVLVLFLLSVAAEMTWAALLAKRWITWPGALGFALLVNCCSFGLLHLLYRTLFFL